MSLSSFVHRPAHFLFEVTAPDGDGPPADAADGPLLVTLDGAQAATKAQLMDHAATRLGFPAYFGRNWDALADSLPEALWRPDRHQAVLVFTDADALLSAEPDAEVEHLLRSLQHIIDAFASDAPPFVMKVVFVTAQGLDSRVARIARALNLSVG
jgi:RNAse (barnase) inhibitor barstar